MKKVIVISTCFRYLLRTYQCISSQILLLNGALQMWFFQHLHLQQEPTERKNVNQFILMSLNDFIFHVTFQRLFNPSVHDISSLLKRAITRQIMVVLLKLLLQCITKKQSLETLCSKDRQGCSLIGLLYHTLSSLYCDLMSGLRKFYNDSCKSPNNKIS